MGSLKRHNTWPYLYFAFLDKENKALDCTLFDVRLLVKNQANNIVINTIVGATDSPALWDEEASGQGHYEWTPDDTATIGNYTYEFKFTRKSDGKKFSIPEKGFYSYSIIEDIAVPE